MLAILARRTAAAATAAAVGAGLTQAVHETDVSHSPAAEAAASPASALIREGDSIVMSGDCGGTNTRLQLFRVPADAELKVGHKPPGQLVFAYKYLNSDFSSFEAVCQRFLEDAKAKTNGRLPAVCCLACAGGITDNKVNFTNVEAGWSIDGARLQEALGIPRVQLINDFEAQGYGLLTLEGSERFKLNAAEPRPNSPIACVGAGTGLGECYLTVHKGQYTCWPSEGGHAEYAPRDEITYDLLLYLRKKFEARHRVSVERVVSGPGLGNVYEFLRQHWAYAGRVDPATDAEWDAALPHLKGALVAKGAAKGDVLCVKAVEIFCASYGSEAGTAALKWLPYGGLYISGGIAAKNPSWVQSKAFMDAFRDKGRMSTLLDHVPIYLVMVEDTGERGALFKAVQLLKEK